jgi:hypothetical protein
MSPVEANGGTPLNWFEAAVWCKVNEEARLCETHEWYYACTTGVPLDMLDDFEWTSNIFGSATQVNTAVLMGGGGACTTRTLLQLGSAQVFRCCQ